MILVCGATGFVGRALLPVLAEKHGVRVRGLVGSEFDAVRLRDLGHEAAAADLVEGRGLDPAMRGVKTVVYATDTLSRGGDIVANELEAMQNTMLAARSAGVQRVVFLGHAAASEAAAAPYLVARWAAELAARQSGIETVIVRAPLIVGRGAPLFEWLRGLGARWPIVPLFSWRRTEVEPVALGDVVEALGLAAVEPELGGRELLICGPDRMRAGEVVRAWARATGRRRLFVPLPGEGYTLSTAVGWAQGQRDWRALRLQIETLREAQVCRDPSQRFPLGRRPVNLATALAAVIEGEP